MAEPDPIQMLVERAQAGDREAFSALVERFRDRLRLWIETKARLRLGPSIEIDEVLQETFVRAFESIARFEWQGDDAFEKWLCGIARNVLLKSAKKHRAQQGLEAAADLPALDESPGTALRRDERFERLEKALAGLSPEYRQVVRLARIDGLKVKEIAARLEKTPNAVKHLLARALKELRERFGDTESFHLPHRSLKREGEGDGR